MLKDISLINLSDQNKINCSKKIRCENTEHFANCYWGCICSNFQECQIENNILFSLSSLQAELFLKGYAMGLFSTNNLIPLWCWSANCIQSNKYVNAFNVCFPLNTTSHDANTSHQGGIPWLPHCVCIAL